MGMQGAFDFEFIGNFFHQFFTLRQITIFPQIRKPPHLIPIDGQVTAQNDGDEFFGTIARRLIFSRINRNQHALSPFFLAARCSAKKLCSKARHSSSRRPDVISQR